MREQTENDIAYFNWIQKPYWMSFSSQIWKRAHYLCLLIMAQLGCLWYFTVIQMIFHAKSFHYIAWYCKRCKGYWPPPANKKKRLKWGWFEKPWKSNLTQPNIKSDLRQIITLIEGTLKNIIVWRKQDKHQKLIWGKNRTNKETNDGCQKVSCGLVALCNQEIPLALKWQTTTYTEKIYSISIK